MQIQNIKLIEEFCVAHALARKPMKRWVDLTEQSRWRNLSDIKAVFNSIDYVHGKYVFNLGGNKYRLIAEILFDVQMVFVIYVLTHQEYDSLRL